MPNYPQEVEEVDVKEEDKRAEAGDDEQLTEGMAEWVLWVMHQNAGHWNNGHIEGGSSKPHKRQ